MLAEISCLNMWTLQGVHIIYASPLLAYPEKLIEVEMSVSQKSRNY